MNNVELYSSANELQRHDARILLEEYASKIKWRDHGDRTIDIGCGDGGVLMDIIKKYIPNNYEAIVGCDINEKMVKYADKLYSDERTKFIILNIEGDIPKPLRNSFDHAFSFYVLHWIKDQTRAFRNMYDLLAEGGDVLVMFLGNTTVFDTYRELAKNNKWAEYMGDINKYISPFHDSLEPDKEVRKIMVETGYKNIKVECRKNGYKFSNLEALRQTLQAVNPFKIPKAMYEDFIENCVEVFSETMFNGKPNNEYFYQVKERKKYTLIIAYVMRVDLKTPLSSFSHNAPKAV